MAFSLIELKNIDTGKTIRGVEVNIATESRRVVGGSLGLAVASSLFGGSTQVTYRNIRDKGHIFLRGEDLSEVVSFLNQTVQAIGQKQTEMKIYKVSLQQGFELGMMHDPEAKSTESASAPQTRPEWKFIITAKDATFRLDYSNGLEVIRTLAAWEQKLSEENRN